MESVKSARARLGRYPALLASCAPQVKLLLLSSCSLAPAPKLQLLKLHAPYFHFPTPPPPAAQAAAYGKCVGNLLGEVQKDQCKAEFDTFIKCVRASAQKTGIRL